jgi:hypothetical protein
MDIGVFIPINNNGWIISATSPQYMPSFELNKRVVLKAEDASIALDRDNDEIMSDQAALKMRTDCATKQYRKTSIGAASTVINSGGVTHASRRLSSRRHSAGVDILTGR